MLVTRRNNPTETLTVRENDGRLIAKLEVTKIHGIANGYAVALTIAKANSDPEEHVFTAASKPVTKEV